jgi:hypothetical protein
MSVENGSYVALAGENTMLFLRLVEGAKGGRYKGCFVSEVIPEPFGEERLIELLKVVREVVSKY